MKTFAGFKIDKFFVTISFGLLLSFLGADAKAATSPYSTVETNIPLNQATNDSINGVLPYFVSHSPQEGSSDYLVDATSADAPTGNVILGPDNTWLGVAWDFGEPASGYIWKLVRADVWIAAGDDLRKGIQADISVSSSGDPGDFVVVSNSYHWAGLNHNEQFNHVRWDFPDEFIAGPTNTMDRYPVKDFRYLRLNSRGDRINNTDWQTRFVEFDVWVSQVPHPDTPIISNPTRNENGDVIFSWNSVVGRIYSVDYKTNLSQPGWISIEPTITADSNNTAFTNSTAGESERYYRVVLKP
jgi:hypothetical protein